VAVDRAAGARRLPQPYKEQEARVIRSMFVVGAAALLLPTCGREAPDAQERNVAAGAGDYQARLEALPEAQRNAVFIRAIRDAGQPCQGVQSSVRQGEINNAPAWTATCEGGVRWTIAIGSDGVAQVMSTADLQALAERSGKAP